MWFPDTGANVLYSPCKNAPWALLFWPSGFPLPCSIQSTEFIAGWCCVSFRADAEQTAETGPLSETAVIFVVRLEEVLEYQQFEK